MDAGGRHHRFIKEKRKMYENGIMSELPTQREPLALGLFLIKLNFLVHRAAALC